jgi:hypothetical protein
MDEFDVLLNKISDMADETYNHFNALTGNENLRNRLIDLLTIELRLRADFQDESSLQFREKIKEVIIRHLNEPQPEQSPEIYMPIK